MVLFFAVEGVIIGILPNEIAVIVTKKRRGELMNIKHVLYGIILRGQNGIGCLSNASVA
jgi:hypothetical protein